MSDAARVARWVAAAAAASLAACATGRADEDRPFLVRAVPGPDGYQRSYGFERGALAIRVTCDVEDAHPSFEMELTNRGGGRIAFSPTGSRLLYDGRVQQSGVQMFDASGTRLLQLVLLANDRQTVTLRPVGLVGPPESLVVLEVRGIRDDRGDGGFDFDLRAMREADPRPESQAPAAAGEETPPRNTTLGDTIRR